MLFRFNVWLRRVSFQPIITSLRFVVGLVHLGWRDKDARVEQLRVFFGHVVRPSYLADDGAGFIEFLHIMRGLTFCSAMVGSPQRSPGLVIFLRYSSFLEDSAEMFSHVALGLGYHDQHSF